MLDATAFTNATWTLKTPTPYVALSFLTSGGNGGCTFRYTVYRADGSSESGTANSPDWFNVPNNIIWIANGRVNAQNYTLNNYNSNNPRLYAVDVNLSESPSPITRIQFDYVSGNATGHSCIMAIAGATVPGGPFTPVLGTGYTADIVVEAGVPERGPVSGYTTASMDNGINNTGNTWYEQGYVTSYPTTGLPPAGSIITSVDASDHQFKLPPSYTAVSYTHLTLP
ncbi:MAG: hypothetical protein N3G20_07185, partial [Verrucomicrobiae bacterium]|nr:hypothetical protein [Verrucomicrobiae bacterium]